MGQKEKKKREIISQYSTGKYSLRELAGLYEIGSSTIHRWVKAAEKERWIKGEYEEGRVVVRPRKDEDEAETEIKRLRAELKDAQLYNKLLNKMIEIAEEDLGVDIRKKHGSGW